MIKLAEGPFTRLSQDDKATARQQSHCSEINGLPRYHATPNRDDFQWKLYRIAEDFSQSINLVAENPAKRKELQAAFEIEAQKYNVDPLDFSLAERTDVRRRPGLTRGRDTFTYYPGTIRVPEGAAPDLKNKDFSVTAEVEIPAGGADGVLITQGERFGGWGLLLLEGKPVFVHSFSQQKQHKYRVASADKLAPGKHTLKFEFKYDGPGMGKSSTGTLTVDGKPAAKGEIERTVPLRFSLDETMDGHRSAGGRGLPGEDAVQVLW